MREGVGGLPFVEVLRDLLAWLTDCGLDGAIIGGVAASILGRPRMTQDVDVLTMAEPGRWQQMLETAGDHGLVARPDDPVELAHRHRVLLLRHGATGTDVDVTLGGLPFEEAIIRRAVRVQAGGLTIPVATPEDLMVMKALARRPRDWADVEALLQHHPDADLDYVKRRLREFSAALGREEILEDFLELTRTSR